MLSRSCRSTTSVWSPEALRYGVFFASLCYFIPNFSPCRVWISRRNGLKDRRNLLSFCIAKKSHQSTPIDAWLTPRMHSCLSQRRRSLRIRYFTARNISPLCSCDITQIFYWTFFVFLVLLLVGVMSIFSMEVIPDSLLFAKFQSSRTGKID